jgi:hypothetical protein
MLSNPGRAIGIAQLHEHTETAENVETGTGGGMIVRLARSA